MSAKNPPWLKPNASEHGLCFSAEQAQNNLEALRQLLGPKFLATANQAPRYIRHPIIQKWISQSPDAYLQLNALAEDLKQVVHTDGVQQILTDLKDVDRCTATWHTVHMAALFARSEGTRVERFFPQTDESLPDFLVSTPLGSFACEAKALASSGIEQSFGEYAKLLSRQIQQCLMQEDRTYPMMSIVIKDSEALPPLQDVLKVLQQGLSQYVGSHLSMRSTAWNAFLDPTDAVAKGLHEVRAINILGKRSEKEDLRVHRHGKQASKQLSGGPTRDVPGVLALAIGDLQEPEFLEAMFRSRFSAGHYPGLSSVVLVRSGTHTAPPVAAPADLIAVVHNSLAALKTPRFKLQPVGLIGRLRDANPKPHVAAYRFQMIQGKVTESRKDAMLGLHDLRWLTPEMLAD